MIKSSINLLQAELKPKKQFITLNNFALIWLFVTATMVVVAGYTHWQSTSLTAKASKLQRQNQQLNSQLTTLKQRHANHKANNELVAELDTLKSLIKNKRYLHSHLTNTEDSYIAGFAAAMTEFSELHDANISLQHILINENQMTFAGLARNANAVPTWLTNFEKSKVLSGKTFQQLKMAEQEDGKLIEFSVSSNAPYSQERQ